MLGSRVLSTRNPTVHYGEVICYPHLQTTTLRCLGLDHGFYLYMHFARKGVAHLGTWSQG